jgi:hypothetical protein
MGKQAAPPSSFDYKTKKGPDKEKSMEKPFRKEWEKDKVETGNTLGPGRFIGGRPKGSGKSLSLL